MLGLVLDCEIKSEFHPFQSINQSIRGPPPLLCPARVLIKRKMPSIAEQQRHTLSLGPLLLLLLRTSCSGGHLGNRFRMVMVLRLSKDLGKFWRGVKISAKALAAR